MKHSVETSADWLPSDASLPPVGQHLPWLQQMRQQALAHFSQVGLPGIRDEQWRYTNLRALKNNAFVFSSPDRDTNLVLPETSNPRMVFVDGFYRADLSNLAQLEGGILCLSLAELLSGPATQIESLFGSSLPAEQHGFSALNTAYCADGFVVILAENSVFEGVLEICFVAASAGNGEQYPMAHNRNLVIAGANSQATIVERHLGSDGNVYLHNTITEIHAGENAHIDHYKLVKESSDAFHIGGVFIKQAANSQVKNHNIALGGLVTRNDINCNLLGQGAHVEMNGLVLGTGRQHVDNHTEVNHAVPNCSSNEYYRTILDDNSRSVFRGRIIVAQDAQQTNADQQNNNLLLSAHAEADSKPQLEIYADDVQCSHGATVGQLDPKSLFYLRSRGIDHDSATALLTFAFANRVIERFNVESVSKQVTEIIAGQLLHGLEELL